MGSSAGAVLPTTPVTDRETVCSTAPSLCADFAPVQSFLTPPQNRPPHSATDPRSLGRLLRLSFSPPLVPRSLPREAYARQLVCHVSHSRAPDKAPPSRRTGAPVREGERFQPAPTSSLGTREPRRCELLVTRHTSLFRHFRPFGLLPLTPASPAAEKSPRMPVAHCKRRRTRAPRPQTPAEARPAPSARGRARYSRRSGPAT